MILSTMRSLYVRSSTKLASVELLDSPYSQLNQQFALLL